MLVLFFKTVLKSIEKLRKLPVFKLVPEMANKTDKRAVQKASSVYVLRSRLVSVAVSLAQLTVTEVKLSLRAQSVSASAIQKIIRNHFQQYLFLNGHGIEIAFKIQNTHSYLFVKQEPNKYLKSACQCWVCHNL